MIRLATPDDIPALVEHGRRHPAAEDFDEGKFADWLAEALESDKFRAVISETGSLGLVYAAPPWGQRIVGVEVWWFAGGGCGKALIDAAIIVARHEGVDEFQVSSMTAHRGGAVARKLRSWGFEERERALFRRIS